MSELVPQLRLPLVLAFAALAWPSGPALAQGSYFAPEGPEFRVNGGASWPQFWGRASMSADGALIATCFNSGQEVFARFFTGAGAPLTGDVICNPTITQGTQDEVELRYSVGGRALVVYNDRNGYDGQLMGIFGRLFSSQGQPLGMEFQVNAIWQASQWRPLLAARPAGGWIVAWTGNWDGDSFIRVLDEDGVPQTGDLRIHNTFISGAQVDPDVAVEPGGNALVVFVDYTNAGNIGSGLNLWYRMYTQDGVALQPAPVPLNTPAFTPGDQREPRVTVDGAGNFIVVWHDQLQDGAGYGIVARRFDRNGVALGGEFQVNAIAAGSQINARAAADSHGSFTVVWETADATQSDIYARRFDAQGQPLGGDVLINEVTAGSQIRPSLDTSASGERVFLLWDGPGDSTDVFGRFFLTYQPPQGYCTPKINSLGCVPTISSSGNATLTGADNFHLLATQIINGQPGLLFWGLNPAAIPFGVGTLCVNPPIVRTNVQFSGGQPAPPFDCTGSFDFHFSQAYMSSAALVPGMTLYCQWWSRDPGPSSGDSVSLTAGLSFELRH